MTTETIPASWSKFKMLRGSSASQFIASLVMRLAQLDKVSEEGPSWPITLSLLFSPTAYLSATQQRAARIGHQSLERFELVLDIGEQKGSSFQLSGWSTFDFHYLAFLNLICRFLSFRVIPSRRFLQQLYSSSHRRYYKVIRGLPSLARKVGGCDDQLRSGNRN